jgi:hypothetical protein
VIDFVLPCVNSLMEADDSKACTIDISAMSIATTRKVLSTMRRLWEQSTPLVPFNPNQIIDEVGCTYEAFCFAFVCNSAIKRHRKVTSTS